MTECNHEALSLSNCRKCQVRVNFSGGSISSNGAALLLREVDRGMGLTASVARALGDRRQREKVRHEVVTMVRQRVHAMALGCEDLNDHHALRADPVVQTACERDESLASSSMLCRFEQRAERQWATAIQQQLVEQFIGSFKHRPEELVLDFDATDDPVHGHQTGPFFRGVLRPVLLSAAVRVLRETVSGRLPPAVEHRCVEACLGDIVVAGQAAEPGMARGSYGVSGRLGVLPTPDARLVRPKRCAVHRGVGPQSGFRTRGSSGVRGRPGRVRGDRSEESAVSRVPVRRAELAAHLAGHRLHRARAEGTKPTLHPDQRRG